MVDDVDHQAFDIIPGRESGLLNFSGEILTPRAMSFGDRVSSAFVPRFHMGASANFNGTRYAYAGACICMCMYVYVYRA